MDSSKLEKLIKEKLVLFEFEADATQLTALILKLVEKKRLDNPDEKVARFFEPFFKDQALDFVKCVSSALKEDRNHDETKNVPIAKEVNVVNKLTSENVNNSEKKDTGNFTGNDNVKNIPNLKNELGNNASRTKRKAISEDKLEESDKANSEPPTKISANSVKYSSTEEANNVIKNEKVDSTTTSSLSDDKKKDLQTKPTGTDESTVTKERPKRQRIVFDIGSTGEQTNKNENHKKTDDSNNSNLPKTRHSNNDGLCNIAKRALGDLVNSDRVAQRKARFGIEKTAPKDDEKNRKRKSDVTDNNKSDKVYRLKPPIDKEAYSAVKNLPAKKKKYNLDNSEQNDAKRFTADCTTKVVLKSDESSSEEEDTNIDEIINNYYSKKPCEENNKDKKNEITVVSQSAFTQHMIPNKVGTRCRFWPQCRNSDDDCPFIHPAKICTNFPYCFYGAHCLYIHPVCKFNGNCLNVNCVYTHISSNQPLPLEDEKDGKQNESAESNACIQLSEDPKPIVHSETLSIIPCSFGSKCKKPACPYKHPKLCRYGNECNNAYCTFRHLDIQSPEKALVPTSDEKEEKVLENGGKVAEETSSLISLASEK
uniref:Zinc finger CCCH domain-containing protein 14 n=1 Tax=Strongyloides papillosus TaxID=174720 RepID=A0A0N5C6Q1_STREA